MLFGGPQQLQQLAGGGAGRLYLRCAGAAGEGGDGEDGASVGGYRRYKGKLTQKAVLTWLKKHSPAARARWQDVLLAIEENKKKGGSVAARDDAGAVEVARAADAQRAGEL